MSVYEIIEDTERMTITVGPMVWTEPVFARVPEWETHYKEMVVDRPAGLSVKDVNKFYCEQVGPKFNRRFYAANYWLWLGHRFEKMTANMLRRSGSSGWRHYSPELVRRANAAYNYVKEAEGDALFHIIPAIVCFGKSPSDIKRQIGKGAWKRIANTSRSRNMRIMQAVERVQQGSGDWGDSYVRLLDYPSGVLNAVMWLDNVTDIAARVANPKTFQGFETAFHIIRDAERMGVGVNPSWSLARIRREHDEAALAKRRGYYSEKAFRSGWSFEADGFTARLLVSPLEIATEGVVQHHCAGSYAYMAKEGSYAVLKVEGRERATIGLRPTVQGWAMEQVFGACNEPVSPKCREFAFDVAAALTRHDRIEVAA